MDLLTRTLRAINKVLITPDLASDGFMIRIAHNLQEAHARQDIAQVIMYCQLIEAIY